MRLHRFLCKADFVGRSFVEIKDQEQIQQIKNVLRLRQGDRLIIIDGNGHEAMAEIFNFSKGHLKLKILEVKKNTGEGVRDVILYCAVLKKENFELVVQKATEVGAREIAPILTERTVKLNLKIERLEKIIKEAVEQSGRGVVPILHPLMTLEQAMTHTKQNSLNLFCDASGERLSAQAIGGARKVGIFIGPEGGWTDEELKLALQNDFKIVSLGQLTLRAETAVIIAAYFAANFSSR